MAGFGGGGFTPGRHDLDGNFTVRDGDISGSQAGIFVGGIVTEGNLDVSGSFTVKGPTTVISASHLVINDSMIGLGFAGDQDLTGAVGDRGMVYGLTGDLNQAFFWDQTSGSFVLGKVKDQGPAYETLDVADANLSMLRNGGLLSIGHISGSAFGTFVGGLVTEGDLDVSGSTALGAVTMAAISGSSTLDIKGDTFLNGDLNVTGSGKTIRAAALDLGDGNITNVGDIALDSISSDAGTSITVTLGVDAGDDFIVGNNNAFVVEGDNDRVGIGVTDPEALLHVHTGDSGQAPHATADDLFIESDGAAGMSIFGGQDNSARIYFGSSRYLAASQGPRAGQIDYNLQDNVMKLATSGSTRITIDSAGSVGIGETAPSSRLHVRDTDKALTLEKDASGYFNSFGFDGNVPYMTYYASTGMQIGYGETTGQAPTVDTMFLKNDGTVGIGTTAPDCTLNVAGALAASGPSKTFQTFASGDYTPSVANGNLFKTYNGFSEGATSFDDGVAGQIVTIISTNSFTYMVSGSANLKGGTTNIATNDGDVTTWVYDGTYWYLMNFMDQSADLSGGH